MGGHRNAVRCGHWNAARNGPKSELRLALGFLLVLRLSFRKRLTLRLTIRLVLPNGLVLVIQKRLGLSLLTFRHEIGLVLQNRLTLLYKIKSIGVSFELVLKQERLGISKI